MWIDTVMQAEAEPDSSAIRSLRQEQVDLFEKAASRLQSLGAAAFFGPGFKDKCAPADC